MLAAFQNRRYFDFDAPPTPEELAEAADREERRRRRERPVSLPKDAHQRLYEALSHEPYGPATTIPANAHERMRRAFTGR